MSAAFSSLHSTPHCHHPSSLALNLVCFLPSSIHHPLRTLATKFASLATRSLLPLVLALLFFSRLFFFFFLFYLSSSLLIVLAAVTPVSSLPSLPSSSSCSTTSYYCIPLLASPFCFYSLVANFFFAARLPSSPVITFFIPSLT